MSYILDALRRAEAERERGSVPGLHSPGLPLGGPAGAAPAGGPAQPGRALWLAGGVALAVLGVALGAWWAGGRAPAPGSVVGDPAVAGPAAAELGPPARARAAQAEVPAAATEPLLRLPTPPTAATAPATAPAPAAIPASPAAPAVPDLTARVQAEPAATASTTQPEMPQTRSAAGSAGTGAGAGASLSVIALSALPPELRAAWPPLAIGGSIYSANAASRFIMANGQVVREGQTAAPGVVVERIGRSAVVLQWRGLRVEVPV